VRRFAGVAVIAVVLALYIGLVGQRAIAFLATGLAVGVAIGVALLVMAVIGLLLLVLELRFGLRITRLAKQIEREGGTPDDEVPLRPSGRVERDAADALFPRYKAEVEAAPDSWRAWFRLGVVYDAAGDRRRARSAMRTALRYSGGRGARTPPT
jgi:cytochrome c-type biogenesis protein CcmH/NrfG